MIRKLFISALVLAPALSWAAGQKVEVKIDGMHCASCSKAVKESLAKILARLRQLFA